MWSGSGLDQVFVPRTGAAGKGGCVVIEKKVLFFSFSNYFSRKLIAATIAQIWQIWSMLCCHRLTVIEIHCMKLLNSRSSWETHSTTQVAAIHTVRCEHNLLALFGDSHLTQCLHLDMVVGRSVDYCRCRTLLVDIRWILHVRKMRGFLYFGTLCLWIEFGCLCIHLLCRGNRPIVRRRELWRRVDRGVERSDFFGVFWKFEEWGAARVDICYFYVLMARWLTYFPVVAGSHVYWMYSLNFVCLACVRVQLIESIDLSSYFMLYSSTHIARLSLVLTSFITLVSIHNLNFDWHIQHFTLFRHTHLLKVQI